MSELIIYHHLGLGDHIICNGLVRELSKDYDKTFLFCKPQNAESVADMYSDLNLELIIGNDDTARDFIVANPEKKYATVGFNGLNNIEPFDYQFYKLVGLNFEKRWDGFFVPTSKKEDELYKKLSSIFEVDGFCGGYALCHDDDRYEMDFDKIKIPLAISVQKLDGFSLPNWRKVIENAAEVHVIDSSVMFLVDSLPENGQKLFVHRYARENPFWQLPTLKRDWKIL